MSLYRAYRVFTGFGPHVVPIEKLKKTTTIRLMMIYWPSRWIYTVAILFSLSISLSLSLSASLVHGLARFTELSRCVQMSVSRPSIKWLRRPNIFLSTPIWPASPTRFIDSNEHPKSWASRSCLFFFFQERKRRSIHQDTIRSSLPTADWIRVFVGPTAQIHGLDSFYRDSLVVRLD